MDLNEYQKAANKTANYPTCEYPFLCLSEEIGELAEKWWCEDCDNKEQAKEMIKEMGDCYWEIAECCTQLEVWLDEVYPEGEVYTPSYGIDQSVQDLVLQATKMQGRINKYMRKEMVSCQTAISQAIYARKASGIPNAAEFRNSLIGYLTNCLMIIEFLSMHLRVTPSEIMQINIDKLQSRKQRGVIDGSGDDR